jgi:hypothetical protein
MDVHDQLNQLAAMVRGAKTMPMSASCLINRAEMLDILERLRDELPANLDHADALLSERDAVLAAGREQAERLLAGARVECERLIEQADVLVVARARAATVTTAAQAESTRLRADADDYVEGKLAESTRLLTDADDYVDRKLAQFEVILGQLGSQVNNGRLRLTARREADLARLQETAHEQDAPAQARPEPHPTPEPEAVDQRGAGAAGASSEFVDPAFG